MVALLNQQFNSFWMAVSELRQVEGQEVVEVQVDMAVPRLEVTAVESNLFKHG